MSAKRIASVIIASGITLSSAAFETNAAEYAFTAYPLGTLAFGAGITPPSGFYVTEAVSFYEGSIGGTFNFGEHIFNAGVLCRLSSQRNEGDDY